MTSDTERQRTVVLGFDALDFRYLDAFADDLPGFSALREAGVEAPLDSTFPPWTGSAWPSMYTGTDPGEHGTFGFFTYEDGDPERASVVTRRDVARPALWNYLDARDLPAVVLNVPVTNPADSISGVLVPGYLAPEAASGHPDGIRDELDEAVGAGYSIYSRAESSDDGEEKLAGYLDLVDCRTEAARYLLSEYDWQTAIVQVQKTDAVFHNFDDPDVFRQVYRKADALVSAMRDCAPDANVLVCSDHGIGPVDGYGIYVNEVLAREGLVEPAADATHPSLASHKSDLKGDGTDEADGPGVAARVAASAGSLLSRAGISPAAVYSAADAVGLRSHLRSLVPRAAVTGAKRGVDWERSAAYCRLGSELGVRINLAGRDRNGVVPQEEYETVRDRVVDALSGLRTPDGEPAFEWVRRREEVYTGPNAEDACDVLFMPAEMNHVVNTKLVGEPFVPYDDHNHKRTGVFLAAGPAIDDGADLARLSLTDVAPIALAASGLPVPGRMTGSVPEGLLTRPVRRASYGDVPFGDGATLGDRDEVTAHLQDLGYM